MNKTFEQHFNKYIEFLVEEQGIDANDKLLLAHLKNFKQSAQYLFPPNSYIAIEDIFKYLNSIDPSITKDGIKLGDKNITLIKVSTKESKELI